MCRQTRKEIENEVASATKQNRIEIISTQLNNLQNEGKKMLKEIEGLTIDNQNKQEMYNATINKIKADTLLLYKQAIKTDAETALTRATTALTAEQINLSFAQRQKTWKEIEKIKKDMAEIDAQIELIETQKEMITWDKTTRIISMIQGTAEAASKLIR